MPLVDSPTAQISSADSAVTPSRTLSYDPPLGLGTMRQRVPSQCSTSVCDVPATAPCEPTAQISSGASAVRPVRELKNALALGLATTFQRVPSQCSINVFCGCS